MLKKIILPVIATASIAAVGIASAKLITIAAAEQQTEQNSPSPQAPAHSLGSPNIAPSDLLCLNPSESPDVMAAGTALTATAEQPTEKNSPSPQASVYSLGNRNIAPSDRFNWNASESPDANETECTQTPKEPRFKLTTRAPDAPPSIRFN